MSSRYTAYSLALELKCINVDEMLEEMTAMQFNEWLAFFKIREELREKPGTTKDKKDLSKGLIDAFKGFQKQ